MCCFVNGWLLLGALSAGLSVAAGAFAAHGLDNYLEQKYGSETRTVGGREMLRSEKYRHDFKTGAEYQMFHSLALIAVGLLQDRRKTVSACVAGWGFSLGILLFSGSLYVLTITGHTTWGMVTPFGGVAFLVGWAALAAVAIAKDAQTLP
jgi:uncharacterized membrane protein YgdD (TMEM256/DUF423 family)